MADRLFKTPLRALDAAGDGISGAKVSLFQTGTSTPVTGYTDAGAGTAHPTPLESDGGGTFAEIFVIGSAGIKVDVTDASGTSLDGYPVDPVLPESSTSTGAANISFNPTTDIPETDVQAAIELVNNVVNDPTPQLGGPLDTNSKAVYWSQGADVASATELLVLTDGNSFDVTGTTTIATIEDTADAFGIGAVIKLQFDGVLTLTHHATNLVLLGGASITTAAGDWATFIKSAAGDWRMESFNGISATADWRAGTSTKPSLASPADVAASAVLNGAFGNQLLHVRDEKTNGTNAGTSSSGVNTRVLNTSVTNEITGASLSSNQITLPAGTYYLTAAAPVYKGEENKLYLYNTSDAAAEVIGMSFRDGATNGDVTIAVVAGRFTIAGTKTFELRHYIAVGRTDGLGRDASAGLTEVYADAQIWKVA